MTISRLHVYIGFLVLALSFHSTICMDICSAKDQANFKLNLLGTSLFKDYILLITTDFTVYEVPVSNFANSYGRMQLFNISGIPLEKKWPNIVQFPNYTVVKSHIVTVWHVDKVRPFLYFMSTDNMTGICYDLKGHSLYHGLRFVYDNRSVQFITDEWRHWYMIETIRGYPYLSIYNVTFHPNGRYQKATMATIGYMVYSVDSRNPTKKNVSIIYQPGEVPPPKNPYANMTGYETYTIENPAAEWDLTRHSTPTGYLHKSRFHLYSRTKVFIFGDQMDQFIPISNYTKNHMVNRILYSVPLKVVPFKDFFECDNPSVSNHSSNVTYPPVELSSSTLAHKPTPKSDSWKWIVIGCVVALLVVLVILAVACIPGITGGGSGKERKSKKSKHHRSSHKGANEAKTSSSAVGASSVVSSAASQAKPKEKNSVSIYGVSSSGVSSSTAAKPKERKTVAASAASKNSQLSQAKKLK